MATWRNGYAEDCKSLYPGSIPGVASKKNLVLVIKKSKFCFLYSSVAQLVEQLTVNQLVAGSSPARGAISPSGGIGRHAGLRNLCESVGVRVPPWAPFV